MNKLYLIFMTVLVAMLCTSMVSAAISVTTTLDKTHPIFGSASQAASNPNADDNDKENIFVSGTVSVSNSDTVNAVTIGRIAVTPLNGFSTSDINITLTSAVTVAPNGTNTVNLNARIPEDLDAVETDDSLDDYLDPVAIKVATITLQDNSGNTLQSFDAYMQRANKLVFATGKIYMKVNDGSYFYMKDGEKTDDSIRPGEDLSVYAEIKNKFTSSDEVTFDEPELTFLLNADTDSSWDWSDVDPDSYSFDTLDASDTSDNENKPIEDITIDEDVDEYARYVAWVYIIGDDDYGAVHGEKVDIELDIKRDSYDFVISSAILSPSSIGCQASRSGSVDVRLESLGKNDDDEIAVYVQSKELGLNFKKTNLKMDGFGDSKDTLAVSVPFSVASTFAAGTYPVRVTLYYSGDETKGVQADLKDLDLVLEKCGSAVTPVTPQQNTTTIIVDTTPITPGSANLPPQVAKDFGFVETTETSFFDTRAFDILLVVAVLAALGALVFLVVKFMIL